MLIAGNEPYLQKWKSHGVILKYPFLSITFFPQDVTLRESELTALRKQIEREYEDKVRTEESIMEKLRNQMTLDKAAQYSKKVTDKIKKRGTELVSL